MKVEEALYEEALKACEKGEVPVGCVIVKGDKILAKAHNLVESLKDATAHAEVLALRKASEVLGDWRLTGCEVHVSLEPCIMCSYALVLSRVDKVVFYALDKRHGGVMSLYNLLDDDRINHRVRWEYRPDDRYAELLRRFFRERRSKS